jgi:hypothetical protein
MEPAAYRKRLSRACRQLYGFVRSWCGVFDPANPCQCSRQVACALERGAAAARSTRARDRRDDRPVPGRPNPCATPITAQPDAVVETIRSLLDARRLELLSH